MNTEEIIKSYENHLNGEIESLYTHSGGINSVNSDAISLYVKHPTSEEDTIRFRTTTARLSSEYFDKFGIMITPVSNTAPIIPKNP